VIGSLLIANRGEIACRIIRTARRLGIRTIAVYSDADAGSAHVRAADEAVHIGASPARESYLVGERIIAAARQTSADAIHPGYGFLSENADFAEAVQAAGIVWIGPDPDSIRAMGLKDAAKARMIAAGVPVTPGYLGEDQSPERLQAEADAIGYPVLIKAVAGGGGKGMRQVETPGAFAEALQSCRREAASSFGDDRVLIEKYILSPRHIEVQVFGDKAGQVVHLFERDCSLQRRHQKVIEEAPAPGMDEATRAAVCAAAVKAAQAVSYVGAGTIEFIADASQGLRADRIWFMEMNTRLQVEHPVTEAVALNGWAMEARLYAEDPASGFLPSTGTLDVFELDGDVRVDTGVEQGATISPYYDPMIAKVIAHGTTRDEARHKLATALGKSVVWPVRTNAGFLVRALEHAGFAAGMVDTGLIAREGEALMPRLVPGAGALAQAAGEIAGAGPFAGLRLNAAPRLEGTFLLAGAPVTIDNPVLRGPGTGGVLVSEAGQTWELRAWRVDGGASGGASDGSILSPMPGRVIALDVLEGERVAKGQKLLTLEAMKMEHGLVAPFDGTVEALSATVGAQVSEGALLVRIAAETV
jgi:3-methylcrotonyl-CoA carboxylase alpha subunit